MAGELEGLQHLTSVATLDAGQLKRDLQARVADIRALLSRHTTQARQMLRKLLVGKIALDPVAQGRERDYRFRGALSIERLLTGEALQTGTREASVTPAGFEPALAVRHALSQQRLDVRRC